MNNKEKDLSPRELWDLPLSDDPDLNRVADLLAAGLYAKFPPYTDMTLYKRRD